MSKPPANLSNPSITHSCARMIICRSLSSQNLRTRSGPNVTKPGPRALGRKPSTLSLSVGSDQSTSISIIPPLSMVRGLSSSSSCEMCVTLRPMPPCMHATRSSMTAASGNHWNMSLNLFHALTPAASPRRSMHSILNPNKALMSASSWFPRSKCTLSGYSTLSASSRDMVSSENAPRST